VTATEKFDRIFDRALEASGVADDSKGAAALLKIALDSAVASAEFATTVRMQQELTEALANVDSEVAANLAAALDEVKKRRALVKAVA
jgi:hypothetical protein